MASVVKEVRYALRKLARNPGFALITITTLALGIGANSAIFSVVNGIFIKPLPFHNPDRLVMVTSAFPTLGFDRFWISPPEYMELQEQSTSFEAIGAYRVTTSTIEAGDRPMRVTSATATAELFSVLGVPPLVGNVFSPEEDQPGMPLVVMISARLWADAFDSNPRAIGTTIRVNGANATIGGVMPEGFDLEDAGIDVWTPAQLNRSNRQNRGSHFLYLIGRLSEGISPERARSEMEDLLEGWPELIPGTHTPSLDNHRLQINSLKEEAVGGVRTAVFLLFGAVGFVLFIACANVANLLLVRAESRHQEIAARVALGAGKRQLIKQFLTEGVILALLGGATGLLLGISGLKLLLSMNPGSIPRVGEIGLDPAVVIFTLGISVLTGLIFGLAPLGQMGTKTVNRSIRQGGSRNTPGSRRLKMRSVLVVSEVALAVILLVGSSLMMRSFSTLLEVDPGFDHENLLTFQLFLPAQSYPGAIDASGFYDRLEADLAAIPGVTSVARMNGLPPLRLVNANDTQFEGVEGPPDGPSHNTDYWQFVSDDYLETMNIPLVDGRDFSSQDLDPANPSVLVNEALVKVFYPDENPLGRRIRPPGGSNPWFTIVGVVADVKQGGLDQPAGTEVYFHEPQTAQLGFTRRTMNLALRTSRDPDLLLEEVRQTVWSRDATLPLANLQSMSENMSLTLSRPRFLTVLLMLFAGVSLLLASIGTYGVMSYAVSARKKEIGIRMAIGAQAESVQRLVLVQGIRVAAVGLLLGIGGSFLLTRFLESLLFQVSTVDSTTYLVTPLVLATAAMLACYVPARRATTIDPIKVLNQE